jgi:hypothetical protein
MRARVLLRQSLFVHPADTGHVPKAAAVIHGDLRDTNAFGVLLRADAYLDEKGRALEGTPRTLLIPSAKIDHVWIEGD